MPGSEVIGKEEQDAVNEVFEKGGVLSRYGNDARRQNIFRVAKFEEEFAKKIGAKYAYAVSSGTAALKSVLEAFEVGPGDEVITQSHTFIATVEAIFETGATPVIADINKTLNMDPDDLKSRITSKTKVVIPVHMSGVSAEIDKIVKIAKEHNLYVLEDCAQAPGGEYKGKKLGTFGDAGIFSFDFGKMLTTGEGGMIVTNSEDIYKKCRAYQNHGHDFNPNVASMAYDTTKRGGFNFKMMELQGAVGLAQLKKIDMVIKGHRTNKNKIIDGIKNIDGIELREIPDPKGDIGDSVTFLLENEETANKFIEKWTSKGFGVKNLPNSLKWHFAGMWNQLFSKDYPGKSLDTEVWKKSNDIIRRAIAIPVFMKMNDEQINKIVNSVDDIVKEVSTLKVES